MTRLGDEGRGKIGEEATRRDVKRGEDNERRRAERHSGQTCLAVC